MALRSTLLRTVLALTKTNFMFVSVQLGPFHLPGSNTVTKHSSIDSVRPNQYHPRTRKTKHKLQYDKIHTKFARIPLQMEWRSLVLCMCFSLTTYITFNIYVPFVVAHCQRFNSRSVCVLRKIVGTTNGNAIA